MASQQWQTPAEWAAAIDHALTECCCPPGWLPRVPARHHVRCPVYAAFWQIPGYETRLDAAVARAAEVLTDRAIEEWLASP